MNKLDNCIKNHSVILDGLFWIFQTTLALAHTESQGSVSLECHRYKFKVRPLAAVLIFADVGRGRST